MVESGFCLSHSITSIHPVKETLLMAKLTQLQKLKRAVSKLSVTSNSKFNQPDFKGSDIEFKAKTYRPDFVSGSSQNHKNISHTSPLMFYLNDDLNFI